MDDRVKAMVLRMTPYGLAALGLAAALTTHAEPAPAQEAPIAELSQALEEQGSTALSARRFDEASGAFESALVADPRNAAAYLGLAQVALARDLPGQAIGYYREARKLRPSDRAIVAAQGRALVVRGALDRARANLGEVERMCGRATACPEAVALRQAITAAGARTAVQAAAPTTTPDSSTPPRQN